MLGRAGAAAEPLAGITNSVGMKMALIPAGEFSMGSPASEVGRGDDESQHQVQISRPFYMGVYEVTQKEYEAVMGDNPSQFPGDNHPVECVSWERANEFCRRLSQKDGRVYRLPTEAEWEYACRAGTTTPFSDLPRAERQVVRRACFAETAAVGTMGLPNAFGLYDVHGNVWEWCADWYGEYVSGVQKDPTGPREGKDRVMRGGWHGDGRNKVGSAERANILPGFALDDIGFRVVMETKDEDMISREGKE
jgi:formylglycine-generating enzyme required for sulfatase activity